MSDASPGASPSNTERLEGEQRFAALFEKSPFALALTKMPEITIVAVNSAFEALFGFGRDELLGKTSPDLGISDAASQAEVREQVTRQGYCHDFVCKRRARSGVEIWLSLSVDKLTIAGEEYLLTTIQDIDARVRAEGALKRQAELLDLSHDATIVWQPGGAIEAWNRGAEQLYGFSKAEALGRVSHDLLSTIHERPWSQIEATLREEGNWEGEVRHHAKDGREIVVSSRHQLIRGGDGVERVLETNRDISDRKRADLERDTTIGFLRLINESRSLTGLIDSATGFFQRQSGCEAVGIRLRDGDDFPYFETRGFPPEFVALENGLCARDREGHVERDAAGAPVMECMCGNVVCGRFDAAQEFFSERGTFWTNSTSELLATSSEEDRQAQTRNRCNGEGYESVALIALRLGEERFGLLQLNDTRPGRFSPEVIALWERLADQLSIAVAKMRLEGELSLSLDHGRRLEERFRSVLGSALDMHYRSDLRAGVIDYVSPSAKQVVGYTADEVIEMNAAEALSLLHEDDVPEFRAALARLEENDEAEAEYRLRAPDGTYRWLQNRMTTSRDDAGAPIYRHGCVRDVTERRLAGEALLESEERFRVLFEGHGAVMLLMEPRGGQILDANAAAARFYGYSREQLRAMHIGQINQLPPEEVAAERRKAAERGKDMFIFPHRLASGEVRIVEVYSTPVTIQGRPTLFSIIHDVTGRKQAEEALRENEAERVAQQERSRIARDLHDSVTQALFAATLKAEALTLADDSLSNGTFQVAEEVRRLNRGALAQMRTLLLELRGDPLEDVPIAQLLRHLVEAAEGRAGVDVRLTVRGEAQLSPPLQVAVYRIAQEALNNVTRHARASKAWVDLSAEPDRVDLVVGDDGCGFEPSAFDPSHMGLRSMRERADEAGAQLEVVTEPGGGTAITLKWRRD